MAEPIKTVFDNAILDAQTLEKFVNGNDSENASPRLNTPYPTLQKAIKEMFESGGLPATPFATHALMTASSLADDSYALVTNDSDKYKNGFYLKKSGNWQYLSYNYVNDISDTTTALKNLSYDIVQGGTTALIETWQSVVLDKNGKFVRGVDINGQKYIAAQNAVVIDNTVDEYKLPSSLLIDDWQAMTVDKNGKFVKGAKLDNTNWIAKNGQIIPDRRHDVVNKTAYEQVSSITVYSDNVDRMILITGQSLAEGANDNSSDVAVTTTAKYPSNALMPAPHVYPEGAYFDDYASLIEQSKGGNRSKETVCSGIAESILDAVTAASLTLPRLIFGVAAKGGNGYRGDSIRTGLKRGSVVYNEALRLVKKCREISNSKGRDFEVSAVVFIHGEQDNTDKTTRDNYARAISTWQQTLNADINAITNQTAHIQFYVTQSNRATGLMTANTESLIPNAQLDAQFINPNIRTVGAIYDTKPSGDNVHPSGAGYRKIGLMIGHAITQDLLKGYWSPLYARRAYFSADNQITVEYSDNIAIDTSNTIVDTTRLNSYGIDYTDYTASAPSITNATTSGRKLILTLSAIPSGKSHAMHIASRTTVAGSTYRNDGARSAIRSANSYKTDRMDNEPLYFWACQQSIYL